MGHTRIWDLPVRLFHWLLAAAFLTAFLIANLADDEGTLFPIHALAGLGAVFLIVLRIVWGLAGSRWARFSAFELRPSSLVRYLRGTVGGAPSTRSAGHNAATSWFAVATIAVVLGLGVTGFMMGRGREAAKEVHEVFAWSMLALAGLHIAGVVWHSVRHRENLAASMVTGYKNAEPDAAIASSRPWSAVAFLLLIAAFAATLVAGYEQSTRRLTLPLLDGTLQLGETEDGGGSASGEGAERRGDDDD
ncbi:MAG: cytochrome b/b6 domain-containing protein [Thermoanaerobaculia bacterium]